MDGTEVGVLDFNISATQTEALYTKGFQAAQQFLSTWNKDQYLKRFR
ncbi:hypothetical protein [Mycobacterium heckeshornense]